MGKKGMMQKIVVGDGKIACDGKISGDGKIAGDG